MADHGRHAETRNQRWPADAAAPLNGGENGCVTEFDWAWLETPAGTIAVGCSAGGVARVRFGPAPADRGEPGELATRARDQLAEYFTGHRTRFDLPLDWSVTSGPQRHVLQILADQVGYGQTTTYGKLADLAGLPGPVGSSGHGPAGEMLPARAVGTIMGSNPIPVIVPCHRVVASDGLGGYSGGTGLEVKRWLLILEGSLPPTLDWQPA
jgi:methylated-DNA-[protein]-cysteine S-methyltransferase